MGVLPFLGPSLRATLKRAIPRGLIIRALQPGAGRSVLLTFDDGPHSEITPAVLDRLDRYGAKAVFFVIGRRVKRAPQVLSEIHARGHIIGNHSHLHQAHYVLPSEGSPRLCEYYRDAQRCQAVIERAAGYRPKLFRQPGGRLTAVTILAPKLLSLRSVTWTRDVADWRFRTTVEARLGAERLAATIQSGDIVLLHDDNPCVLDLLDDLLPALVSRRFNLQSAINFL